jgi:formylglycine-generating enzyme required for sulfatase activity
MVSVAAPDGTRYCIDSTEVTFAMYQEFLDTKPTTELMPRPLCNGPIDEPLRYGTYEVKDSIWDNFDPAPDHPVRVVSWCAAYAYCAWAGKRLCGRVGGGAHETRVENDANLSEWYNVCTDGGRVTETCSYGPGDIYAVGTVAECEAPVAGVFDMGSNAGEWTGECVDTVCATYSSLPGRKCGLLGWSGAHQPNAGFRCCAD